MSSDNPTRSLATQQTLLSMEMAPQYATALSYGLSQQEKGPLAGGRGIAHTSEEEMTWQRFGGHMATQPTQSLADSRGLLTTPSTSVAEDVLAMHQGNRPESFGRDSVDDFGDSLTANPESLRFTYDLEEHSRSKKQKKDESSFFRDQDRFLPIANVGRMMKLAIPTGGKMSKDAKECMQECASEFISFITSEAAERCLKEKRKTVTGEDILFAMATLGFDNYIEPLKNFLTKYKENVKGEKVSEEGIVSLSGSYSDPLQQLTQLSQATNSGLQVFPTLQ